MALIQFFYLAAKKSISRYCYFPVIIFACELLKGHCDDLNDPSQPAPFSMPSKLLMICIVKVNLFCKLCS